MKKRIPRATRRARLKAGVDRRIYNLICDRVHAAGSPEEALAAVDYLFLLMVENTCQAVRHLDGDRPSKARALLMHSLLMVVSETRTRPIERPRTRREYEQERAARALWEDILEGRKNIEAMLPPEEEDEAPLRVARPDEEPPGRAAEGGVA